MCIVLDIQADPKKILHSEWTTSYEKEARGWEA